MTVIPRCELHGQIPRYGCHPCDVVRWAYKNEYHTPEQRPTAQIPTSGPVCGRCGQAGILSWRTHRVFHQAGGGTPDFSIAEYEELMR